MTTKLVLIAIGVSLLAGGFYALACWWRPLAYCWCCKGNGRHHGKSGKTFRECAGWRCWPRACGGSGRRWRIGRRVWVFFRKRVHT